MAHRSWRAGRRMFLFGRKAADDHRGLQRRRRGTRGLRGKQQSLTTRWRGPILAHGFFFSSHAADITPTKQTLAQRPAYLAGRRCLEQRQPVGAANGRWAAGRKVAEERRSSGPRPLGAAGAGVFGWLREREESVSGKSSGTLSHARRRSPFVVRVPESVLRQRRRRAGGGA